MRYLPAINMADRIWQVAFPDVHAIALAESVWISDRNDRKNAILDLLNTSPSLLLWSAFQFCQAKDHKSKPISGYSSFDLERELVEIVVCNATNIIRDNTNQLSSIQRIEIDSLARIACFFLILNDKSNSFCKKVVERLGVIECSVFEDQECLLSSKLKTLLAEPLTSELILRNYRATDFSAAKQLEQIEESWLLTLPFFRNGFGELDSRLKRIEQLELEFNAEVEKEKIAAMRQLAYGASHEVNNPLANISTRAQALLRDETDPKRRERLMTIDAQAFRAHDMISNLMKFARPPRPQFGRLQLLPVVEKVTERLQTLATIQDTEIVIEVDSSIYFDVDRSQLEEILTELIQNAMEALRQSGQVRIVADWNAGQSPLKINVMDNGPGISTEVRRHIFDPFFSGREAGRGLGFGLSKAWRLMELHHGTIGIVDSLDGANVELQFPIAQDDANVAGIELTA